MSACDHCGAPLARTETVGAVCAYCGTDNPPVPKAVPVPVEVVHRVVHVTSPAAPAARAHELRCPHCGKLLVTVRIEDVGLSGCIGCGGIWIDNASARRVLASPEAVFGELARRAGENAKSRGSRAPRPTCPMCPAVLDRVVTHDIALDVCSPHGTWFDAYELDQMIRALLAGERARAHVPGAVHEIRCAECSTTLPSDRANLTELGLICDGCWRARQAALEAAGDRAAYATGSITVGGALLGVAGVMLGGIASSQRNS